MLQRSQIEPAKGTERQPFLRRVVLWIVARSDKAKKDGILHRLQEQVRAGFSQHPAIPDELLVTLAALHATSAVVADAAFWLNSSAAFGLSDDPINDKIDEALKATATRTLTAPDSTLSQLRASLAKHREAFRKLNGQRE
jgi:hypothetical protein